MIEDWKLGSLKILNWHLVRTNMPKRQSCFGGQLLFESEVFEADEHRYNFVLKGFHLRLKMPPLTNQRK